MSFLRDIVYGVGLVVGTPVWLPGLIATGKWRTDWPGRFGRSAVKSDAKDAEQTLLIHGVSVGEVSLIRGLVEQLRERRPNLRIVVAATTNTGVARAKQLYGESLEVVRYPLDFSFAVRRMLDTVKPDVVATVELEVWPNLVSACTKRGIPIAVINGRLSEKSFRGYRKIRPLLKSTFGKLSAVAAQSEDIAERFVTMGVPRERVRVVDTMKWDNAVVHESTDAEGWPSLGFELGLDPDRPIIVAGSTAPGEDELLIRTRPADVQLVIVPRKPEWFDRVLKFAPDAVRRSTGETRKADVYLLDTMGELKDAYRLADVVLVGRSFVPGFGGSDMMEPIGLGKPTIVGLDHRNFQVVMEALVAERGVILSDDPMKEAAALLTDEDRRETLTQAGLAVIRRHQGGTKRHADMLLDLLASRRRDATPLG